MKVTICRSISERGCAGTNQIDVHTQALWSSLYRIVVLLLLILYISSNELLAAQPVHLREDREREAAAIRTDEGFRQQVRFPWIINDLQVGYLHRKHGFDFETRQKVSVPSWKTSLQFDFNRNQAITIAKGRSSRKAAATGKKLEGNDERSIVDLAAATSLPAPAPSDVGAQQITEVFEPEDQVVSRKRLGLKIALPLRVSGMYSGLVRVEESTKDDLESTIYLNQLNIALNSYIWRPWFALLNSNLGFNTEKYENQGRPNTDNQYVTGNINLNVFPRSRFPFSAYVEKSENKSDLELTSLDYSTVRMFIDQKYRDITGQHNMSVNFEHADRESDTDGTDRMDRLRADYQLNISDHRLSFSADGHKNKNTFLNTDAKTISFLGRHTLRSTHNSSLESLLTFVNVDTEINDRRRDIKTGQLSSFIRWRPQSEERLQLTGSARLFTNELKSGGDQANTSQQLDSIALNSAATFQHSDALILRGSISAIKSRRKANDQFIHTQIMGADYRPPEIPIAGFQYNWGMGSQLQNRSLDNEAEQTASLSGTHGVNRSFDLSESSLQVSLTQGVRLAHATDEDRREFLNHTLLLNWSKARTHSRSDFRVNFNDARSFALDPSLFQLLNFQFNTYYTVDRDTSWTGSITVQGTRQQPAGPDNGTLVDVFTNGSFLYRKQNLFGVPMLQFNSELELVSNGLTPDRYNVETNVVRGDEEQRFRAELRYRIGKIALQFTARILRIDGDVDQSFQIQINRSLGN